MEEKRKEYLEKFKRNNNLEELGWEKSEDLGKQLVEVMKKEDVTYDEAYASLQYAYNLLKYESNFLKIN